ncbi:hypothetical protein [Pseudomonas sp. NPDC089569]|uniref:hypothetical protein n=1 Tax=Pseudomonas sp. NPDC089569 TaxID=3390722 RepID=UPI003CFE22AF
MSSIKSNTAMVDLTGYIVVIFGLNHEVTAWELGRKASLSNGGLDNNPWPSGSWDHDEWARGFEHGRRYDNQKGTDIETVAVVETPLAYPVEPLTERSFWAAANDMQLDQHLSVDQLAGRLGVDVQIVQRSMVAHQFYDEDAIPLGIRVAN